MRLATAEEPSQPSLYMERAPLKKRRDGRGNQSRFLRLPMLIGIVLCAIS